MIFIIQKVYLLTTSIACHSIPLNLLISYWIIPSDHFIPAVSFHSINGSVYHALNNPHMINVSIISRVRENKIAGSGNIAAVHELAPAFKPFHTWRTQRKLGNNSWLNISTLIRTPAYKAGTPFYPAGETIPAPVRVSSISFLCQGHLYDCLISDSRRDTPKHIVSQYMRWSILLLRRTINL